MNNAATFSLGAVYLGGGQCRFTVWAPKANKVDLLLSSQAKPLPLEPSERGYFSVVVEGVRPGDRYRYRLDGVQEFPDPASRYQPEGVYGPSEVIDPDFAWTDADWRGLPLRDYILYELHVGTFTPEGTFDAVIAHLDYLADLGVTVIELMPVAQFPGKRNWGYDGVYPFAAQNSYGGPDGLRRLINACHQRGLGVALDVVYNHLGPEGNYLDAFGHYFTDRYRTPWGRAINFDGRDSDEVRRYFIENALQWTADFHVDSLRLDAVHAIFDESARPFLRELGEAVHEHARQLNRHITVIAESNKNDARQIDAIERGGFGLDAVWNDDFHHALHVLATSEQAGYYADFGGLSRMAKALKDGFIYDGQYSRYRGRRHGISSRHLPPERFVVCSQNHDQVGNRALGDRLGPISSFESQKLAAAMVLLSPNIPLLFMGEEYGETAPFLYFVDHGDPALIEAVRRGRQEEFASFDWKIDLPDPQSEETYLRSKLDWDLQRRPRHTALWNFYRELIRLRKELPALQDPSKNRLEVEADESAGVLTMRRWRGEDQLVALFHFGEGIEWQGVLPPGVWRVLLNSADAQWNGPGSSLGASIESNGVIAVRFSAHQVLLLVAEPDD